MATVLWCYDALSCLATVLVAPGYCTLGVVCDNVATAARATISWTLDVEVSELDRVDDTVGLVSMLGREYGGGNAVSANLASVDAGGDRCGLG